MASEQAEMMRSAMQRLRDHAQNMPQPTLAERRAVTEMLGGLTTDPGGVTWTDVDAGGVPAIWAEPRSCAPDRALLYLHGGGYTAGSASMYRRLTGHIAKAVGCRVLNVDYRLAPEHPHPAALDDAVQAYRFLLRQRIAPSSIACVGDFAGGGLAVATMLRLRAMAIPLPAAAMIMSPWADLDGTGASMTLNADADLAVDTSVLKVMSDAYLDGLSARDPFASPLYADLTGLPPMYIQVGGCEVLLDDSTRLAEHAQRAGIDTRLDIFPDMQHVFQITAGNLPEAIDAIDRIGAWLRPRLDLGPDHTDAEDAAS